MSWFTNCDDDDPVRKAYGRYWRVFRSVCLVLVAMIGVALVAGIPHLQTTYTYSPSHRGGIPTADQKLSAWYISVTGWQHVQSYQYGQEGCPFILFIPFPECVDIEQCKAWIKARYCHESS